ncbi:ral-GDS-related protein-like isoform X2 [Oryctolagus cuniculus]|uniref:ral-GDS-related protein-like isoform X2 n=1 Tax=Oryctolagus cuniculus TaxID=9986 RepID=UPI00387967DB
MKAADRARVVEHWIKVAKECLALRNYCSVHTILCALQSHPVRQLKTTWGEVSRKSARKFQRLCTQDKQVNRDVPMKMAICRLPAREQNPQRTQMRQRLQKKASVPGEGGAGAPVSHWGPMSREQGLLPPLFAHAHHHSS